jgi:hypothetical protein
MARGHFGIFAPLQSFNIRRIQPKRSDSRGTFLGSHRLRASKKEKFRVVRSSVLSRRRLRGAFNEGIWLMPLRCAPGLRA